MDGGQLYGVGIELRPMEDMMELGGWCEYGFKEDCIEG